MPKSKPKSKQVSDNLLLDMMRQQTAYMIVQHNAIVDLLKMVIAQQVMIKELEVEFEDEYPEGPEEDGENLSR